jgi:hypothetical protein
MSLIALVALVAVPLVIAGLHWRWWPIFGYPLPVPWPV